MSVRDLESRFNLRSVVQEETASCALVLAQSSAPKTEPLLVKASAKSGLKFDFSSIQKDRSIPPSRSLHSLQNKPLYISSKLSTSFGSSNPAFVSNPRDVMQPTTTVQDLQARLKRADEKTKSLELQLQRAQVNNVAERESNHDKIRATRNVLEAVRSTEVQLRTELLNGSATQKATIQKLEAAVAAAAAADETAEKRRQNLQKQLGEQMDKTDKATRDVELHKTNYVDLLARTTDLELQLAEVKESEKKALEERDSLELHKRNYVDLLARTTDLELQLAEVKESEKKALEERDSESMNFASIAEPIASRASCESSYSPASSVEEPNVHPSTDLVAQDVPAEVLSKAPVPGTYPDPIKMHARYNRLRDAIINTSACIVAIESGEAHSDKLEDLRAKRGELFKRAKDLKFRYDTMFGAVDSNSVVDFSPSASKSTNEDAMDDISFSPEGDAPSPPCTHIVSFAKEMAQSCPLGGAYDFGSYDSGVPVGNHFVTPIISNVPTQSTGGVNNEMVNAVVTDMTNFLKDAKQRSETNTNL